MALQRVILSAIPGSRLSSDDFSVIEDDRPTRLRQGQVRVRPLLFGLNAGLRNRLGTGRSTTFGPAVGVGDTPRSDAIGVVTASEAGCLSVGQTVVGTLPWASVAVVRAQELATISPADDPIQHLTTLGHVGRTAWAGLVSVGRLRPGQTVWISAAAGGVGSCAVQIADRLGANVIASAGGPGRVGFLRDVLGISAVADRRLDLRGQLEAFAPDGIDLYFDAVGGDHLRLALDLLTPGGTAVLVGRSGNSEHGPVLDDTSQLIRRRLTLAGLSVMDHPEAAGQLLAFADQARPLHAAATVAYGMAAIPESFSALLAGEILGRAVVDVREGAA